MERAILLNALPPEVRTVLANSKAANNKRLAMEANQILEQHLLANARAGAVYELEEPEEEIHAVSAFRSARGGTRHQRRQPLPPRHQQQQQQQQQPYPRQQQQGQGRLCNNHFRFGDRAYACRGGDCPMQFEPLMSKPVGSQGRASGNGRAGR